MYKTIFTWFDNLPTSMELKEFHCYQEKIQSVATVFLVSQELQQHNPNHQKRFLYSVQKIHNGFQNGPKFFLGGNSPSFCSMTKPQKISY